MFIRLVIVTLKLGKKGELNFQYLVAQIMIKNLPSVQETWVQSLCWGDTLKKGIANHSSILAWKTPWTEELQSMGLQRVGHN